MPRDNTPIEPGAVFGRFTVLRQVESRSGKRAYLCRCGCGNERTVQGANLKNGGSTSCNRGECSGNAKLTESQVIEIRRLHREGLSAPQIRQQVGGEISTAAIYKVLKGGAWAHIPEPARPPGARIRAAREAIGTARRELAGWLGVTYQRLADIEADRKPITLESILAVAAALGVDPHSLDERLASRKPLARKAPAG